MLALGIFQMGALLPHKICISQNMNGKLTSWGSVVCSRIDWNVWHVILHWQLDRIIAKSWSKQRKPQRQRNQTKQIKIIKITISCPAAEALLCFFRNNNDFIKLSHPVLYILPLWWSDNWVVPVDISLAVPPYLAAGLICIVSRYRQGHHHQQTQHQGYSLRKERQLYIRMGVCIKDWNKYGEWSSPLQDPCSSSVSGTDYT